MKKILNSVIKFICNPWFVLFLVFLFLFSANDLYHSDGFIFDSDSAIFGFYCAAIYFCLISSIDGFIHRFKEKRNANSQSVN